MEKEKLVEYFEEVETIQEYNGYFYSIAEAISIVVLGSICGLRNISQIHQWAESDKDAEFMNREINFLYMHSEHSNRSPAEVFCFGLLGLKASLSEMLKQRTLLLRTDVPHKIDFPDL